ncbi:hypothetical protein D3C85_1824940 [compost metagenome]
MNFYESGYYNEVNLDFYHHYCSIDRGDWNELLSDVCPQGNNRSSENELDAEYCQNRRAARNDYARKGPFA